MRRKRTKHIKRRVFIPGPDLRNTKRGTEWLSKMIKASEGKKSMDEVVEEMQTPLLKRDREPGEEG